MSESRMNKTELLANNMWGYFTRGFNVTKNATKGVETEYFDAVIFLFHLVSFPVAVPVVGGLKTLIDIKTRKEISLDDLKNLEKLIAVLPNEQFDQFIENVLKYHPRSKSSFQLEVDLIAAQQREKTALSSLVDTAKAEVRKVIVENFRKENPEIDEKKLMFTVRSDYQFTEKEEELEREIIDESTQKFAAKRRQEQRELITKYLEAEKNVGKKMQHVIKDEVERLTSKP